MNWQEFFENHGIEYIARGPSTAKDNLYVHCPFCGDADQGRHMGVSTLGKGWGCWREQSHRGKNPVRLVQALLGCSWPEAERISGARQSHGLAVGLSLGQTVRDKLYGPEEAKKEERNKLVLLPEFKPLREGSPHHRYMRGERHFSTDEIEHLAYGFDLHTCLTGDWRWRLIIPVWEGELVTWTGRAITESKLRYRTLSDDPEKAGKGPCAIGPITDYFLTSSWRFMGGTFLVLVEGPFDCMKLALQSNKFDAEVACLFGKAISPTQLDKLAMRRKRYDRIFLLLDPDARVSSMRLGGRALGIEPFYIKGKQDPGDMNNNQVHELLGQMADRVEGKQK